MKLKKTLIVAVFLAILLMAIVFYVSPEILRNLSKIVNSSPKTPSQGELINYSLSLINADRQSNGLQNVTLSSIQSGQQHAEDMMKKHYFSHWNMQGYKPYVRYTISGGKGAVSENIAAQYGYISNFTKTLENLEWQMMYNDSASDWGHKENILNPLHNRVSIGVAYDQDGVYLVQDFEDDYIQWSTLNVTGSKVEMRGKITKTDVTLEQVGIYFDSATNLTSQQISNTPYQGSYNSGTYVGAAVPPEYQISQGITINAEAWSQTGESFELKFDLALAFAQKGNGIYTLYLWTNDDTFLTTYSIFYTG